MAKDPGPGISLRFIRQYDVSTDQIPSRFDIERVRLRIRPRHRRIRHAWRQFVLLRAQGIPRRLAFRFVWHLLTDRPFHED